MFLLMKAYEAHQAAQAAHAAQQDLAGAQQAANKAYAAAQSAQASAIGQGAYTGFDSGYGGSSGGCPSYGCWSSSKLLPKSSFLELIQIVK